MLWEFLNQVQQTGVCMYRFFRFCGYWTCLHRVGRLHMIRMHNPDSLHRNATINVGQGNLHFFLLLLTFMYPPLGWVSYHPMFHLTWDVLVKLCNQLPAVTKLVEGSQSVAGFWDQCYFKAKLVRKLCNWGWWKPISLLSHLHILVSV
jgi:hypothetical protein